MWRWLYRGLLWLALPWVWLRLAIRARRDPAYGRRIAERFGRVPHDVPRGAIWLHTVSAGETIAAAPLIAELKTRFPALPLLVTTMTPTGSGQVLERLGTSVAHCYAPYDYPFAVRRFLDATRPRLLVVMETELWPHWIELCATRGIAVAIVNARLSERSARGYARVGGLTRRMLAAVRVIACQYPDHAARFVALGADPQKVLTLGSVKFDLLPPDDLQQRLAVWRRQWAITDEPLWVAGSTHPGEETAVLEAHRHVVAAHPRARLVLVPRHPERAGEVADLARQRGFGVALLSTAPHGPWDVMVCDTMGQLMALYAMGAVAFVGGSLVPRGGHNPIEPAVLGRAMIMGPHRFNFADVAERFAAAGCLHEVTDGATLGGCVSALFDQPQAREEQARAAAAVVADNRGAQARLVQLLSELIADATKLNADGIATPPAS